MYSRFIQGHSPKQSYFLFGPRLVGKTTFLSSIEAIFRLNLLQPELQLLYTKDPARLRNEIEAIRPKKGWVIIDEIQKVPLLLDVVHGLIDAHEELHFILSGSSARKLRHGAANLLGGRALYKTLHPLTQYELGGHFSLDKALAYGTLPKVYTKVQNNEYDSAKELLKSYVITYLHEEIKAEALVRNLQGFQNFLDVAAAQFAEQVNFADVARDCKVAYSTVREFYSILEDTLLGFFLPPMLKSTRKRMSHAPKFYFFDNGVTRAILGTLRIPPSPLELGRLFEQWVIQEIYRMNWYLQKDWKLSFWRTSHGAEVDLLIELGKNVVCAIECKYKQVISNADLSGLMAFRENSPKVPCYLVAPVTNIQQIDKTVQIVSPGDLLKILENM